MRRALGWPWQERWEPHELGHSLPIARGLRRAALALAAAALAALLLVVWLLLRLDSPGAEPAGADAVRRTALERLGRTELPVWDPPGELPEAEAPGFASPPPPPLLAIPHPADPPPPPELPGLLDELGETAAFGAATRLDRARFAQPRSWLLAYDSGVAFLGTGFADRAERSFTAAMQRLDAYASGFPRSPAHHAAAVATRYGEGLARGRDDCVEGVRRLKFAVAQLDPFLRSGGAEVPDRRVVFRLSPVPLTNLDVYSALAESYLDCGEYPGTYFERYRGADEFAEAEYANAGAREIRDGPFAEELAACVEAGGTTGRCWALANLNKLHAANRDLLAAESLPPAFEPFRPELARLAYNVALLAATGPAPDGAGRHLQIAGRLDRGGPGEGGLAPEIRRLGLYLARTAEDYTALAEGYRGRSPAAMPFSAGAPAEEIKGMAWALRERWQQLLAQGRPEAVFAEVAQTRQRLPDEHLASLARWEDEAREAIQDALAEEIRTQKRRGNVALAAGLRDYREPWLGDDWPDRADAAWWTPKLHLARAGLLLAFVLFLVGLALLYRSVVYPYLMSTASYYQPELARRTELRKRDGLPVTGEEIQRWQRSRRGEQP